MFLRSYDILQGILSYAGRPGRIRQYVAQQGQIEDLDFWSEIISLNVTLYILAEIFKVAGPHHHYNFQPPPRHRTRDHHDSTCIVMHASRSREGKTPRACGWIL